MTSTIVPSAVRGVSLGESNIRTQFANAKADIEALQDAVSSLAAIVSPPAAPMAPHVITEGE